MCRSQLIAQSVSDLPIPLKPLKFVTRPVLLGCCRVTSQLPIDVCPQHLLYLPVIVTFPHHHSRVLLEMCKGAKQQHDKGPEDSTDGAQGTGGRSDFTSGQGEHNCDDEMWP